MTIFYTITFILALQRQKPRIRALKKSLNVLNKFDTRASIRENSKSMETSASAHTSIIRSSTHSNCAVPNMPRTTRSNGMNQKTILVNSMSQSEESPKKTITTTPSISIQSHIDQHYEMANMTMNPEVDEPSTTSLAPIRNPRSERKRDSEQENRISLSDTASDDLQGCTEKLNGTKQVSFQVQHGRKSSNHKEKQRLSLSTTSLDGALDESQDLYYKFPCPCSKTRQLLIKFHFSRPSAHVNHWLCFCCSLKKRSALNQQQRPLTPIAMEEETSTNLTPLMASPSIPSSHSETLKRQLHRHRLKQIRMALTFLFITVSFVLFYLPSILNAERIIKSSMLVYYLYLCTHALNPLIYCFMNPSLRAYVISLFRCRSSQAKQRSQTVAASTFER